MEIIARPLFIKRFNPEDLGTWSPRWRHRIEEIQREHGVKAMPVFKAAAVAPDPRAEIKEGKRIAEGWITAETLDYSRDIVIAEGVIDRGKVPILVGHDYSPASLPVGRSLWRKRAKMPMLGEDGETCECEGILAGGEYHEHTPLAVQTFALIADKILTDLSIGFIPLETATVTDEDIEQHPWWEGAKQKFTRWVILEYSHVCVGDNPDAMVVQVQKALKTAQLDGCLQEYLAQFVEAAQKPEKKTPPAAKVPEIKGKPAPGWRKSPGSIVAMAAWPDRCLDLRAVRVRGAAGDVIAVSGTCGTARKIVALEYGAEWGDVSARRDAETRIGKIIAWDLTAAVPRDRVPSAQPESSLTTGRPPSAKEVVAEEIARLKGRIE